MAIWQWNGDVEIGTSGQKLTTGTGDPEGVVTAPIGSVYLRVDGGSNHAVYIKESGIGNNGWTAIGSGGTTVTLRHDGSPNSVQNILDLISGNGVTISDLGSGRVKFDGVALKLSGSPISSQTTLDFRAGTAMSVTDTGSGRIQISWLNPLAFKVNGISTGVVDLLNLSAGANIAVTNLGSGSVQIAVTGLSYDIGIPIVDSPGVSESIRYIMPRTVTFLSNFSGSYASCATAATASTVFTVKKNGSTVGTVTFAMSGTTGVFATSGGASVSFVAGDLFELIAPASPDATWANGGFTFTGSR